MDAARDVRSLRDWDARDRDGVIYLRQCLNNGPERHIDESGGDILVQKPGNGVSEQGAESGRTARMATRASAKVKTKESRRFREKLLNEFNMSTGLANIIHMKTPQNYATEVNQKLQALEQLAEHTVRSAR